MKAQKPEIDSLQAIQENLSMDFRNGAFMYKK
jgi:hypothetical protein